MNDLSTQSLHWIVGNEHVTAPVLPLSGTATYALVGSTSPTDTLNHVGTLGAASFSADFTNRLVTSVLTLNMNGTQWYASGKASYGIGGNKFEGTYDDVQIGNLVRGQGTLYGFFTQPRIGNSTASGAGMSFNLTDNSRQLGVISGVLAFSQGRSRRDGRAPGARDARHLLRRTGRGCCRAADGQRCRQRLRGRFELQARRSAWGDSHRHGR